MNEITLLLHLLLVIVFALGALRLGKEALSSWVVLQVILANLFVIKQVSFFGFTATCSDVFAIGSILGLNLLQEYFGKKSAEKTVWTSFYFMLFFALMSQVHLFYVPATHDGSQEAFRTVLSSSPRLFAASLATFFLVQQVDLRFFNFLKKRMESSLLFRNLLSLFVSQLLDTVLFSFLGLYGLVDSLGEIIAVSFLLKVLILVFLSPITLFSKKIVQPS